MLKKPFRNGANFSTQTILSLSLFGTSIFIILGMAGNLNNGYENRFILDEIKRVQGPEEYLKHIKDNYFICSSNEITEEALKSHCLQSKKDTTADIALVGDSHAQQLFLGLAEALKDKNIVYYYHSGAPSLDIQRHKNTFKHLLASDTIGTVILGTMSPDSTRSHITLEKKILEIVNMLIASGKIVYFADDVPIFPFVATRCTWPRWPVSKKCDIGKEFIDSTQGFFSAFLGKYFTISPKVTLNSFEGPSV